MNFLDSDTPLEAQNATLASAQALLSIARSLSRICDILDQRSAMVASSLPPEPMVYGVDFAKSPDIPFDPALKQTKVVNDALMGMPEEIR